jgi:hypothetical protein
MVADDRRDAASIWNPRIGSCRREQMSRRQFAIAVAIAAVVGLVVGVLGSLILQAAGFTGVANSVVLPLAVCLINSLLVAGLLHGAA